MKTHRPLFLPAGLGALSAGAPLAALAAAAPAATQPAAPGSIAGEVIGILLPLALVIIALVAVLYLVRRRFGLTGQDAPLSIVQILPVGSRERIVVVKSRAGRVFAVGVGAQTVTLITNLEQSDIEPASTPDVPADTASTHIASSR
ncbi:FliO/MopB family protein [Luteimonas soli]|uniref:FliO/MopB family protein n=1 Tax=Luteimonas soli TaxID=1648966 RepID=A0ABV7XIS1_9GAMM